MPHVGPNRWKRLGFLPETSYRPLPTARTGTRLDTPGGVTNAEPGSVRLCERWGWVEFGVGWL
jgi:hypothetical protein